MASRGLDIMNAEEMIKHWVAKFPERPDSGNTQRVRSANTAPRIDYDINWSRIKIHHDEPSFTEEALSGMTPNSGFEVESTVNNRGGEEPLKQKSTARRTDSCCEVRFYKGLVIPRRSVLPLPPGLSGGLELVMQETGMEARMEDSMSWQIENSVTVGQGKHVAINTLILEKKWEGTFKVTTRVSGSVVVTIYENNQFKDSIMGDIAVICREAKKSFPRQYPNINFDDRKTVRGELIEGKTVIFETSGHIRYKVHVGHKTTVS